MGFAQLIGFIKEAAVRLLVIMLAVILVMLVASRNVEYELEQEAVQQQTQLADGRFYPDVTKFAVKNCCIYQNLCYTILS